MYEFIYSHKPHQCITMVIVLYNIFTPAQAHQYDTDRKNRILPSIMALYSL